MNKIHILFLVLINISCSKNIANFTQKSNYESAEIKSLHKKIAILPVNYVDNQDSKMLVEKALSKKNKNFLIEQQAVGYQLQKAFFEEFIENLKDLKVQSNTETNDILAKKNIEYNDIRRYSKSELAKILAVDAVFYADLFVDSKESNQTSSVNDVLISVPNKIKLFELIVEIHGNAEEEVVWKAKTVIPATFLNDIRYIQTFKQMIKLDLIPILPYSK